MKKAIEYFGPSIPRYDNDIQFMVKVAVAEEQAVGSAGNIAYDIVSPYKEIYAHVIGGRVTAALHNFFRNAREQIEEKQKERGAGYQGKISIAISELKKDGADKVVIEIKDNAGGFPENMLNTIGKDYVQTTKDGGHGIGILSSVKMIKQSGGEVIISNTDEGARIVIVLPSGGFALLRPDQSVLGESSVNPEASFGGIDFNSNQINLEIENSGENIEFKLNPAQLQQLQDARGFIPVILNIQPVGNLNVFLGVEEPAGAALASI